MAFGLAAPEIRMEWLVVLVGLLAMYTVLFFATSSDPLYTASMSLFSGFLVTATLMILVFVWLGACRTRPDEAIGK